MPFFIFILTHFSSRNSFFTMMQHISTQIQQSVSGSVNHLSLYLHSHCTICHLSPRPSHFSLRDRDDFMWLWSTGLCDGCWVIPNVGPFQAVRCFFPPEQWKRGTESYEGGQEINDWNSTWLCDLTIRCNENLIIIVLSCYFYRPPLQFVTHRMKEYWWPTVDLTTLHFCLPRGPLFIRAGAGGRWGRSSGREAIQSPVEEMASPKTS